MDTEKNALLQSVGIWRQGGRQVPGSLRGGRRHPHHAPEAPEIGFATAWPRIGRGSGIPAAGPRSPEKSLPPTAGRSMIAQESG